MATEKISQLPVVLNAQFTDLIPAVQSSTTVKETLQQVYDLFFRQSGHGALSSGVSNVPNTTVTADTIVYITPTTSLGILRNSSITPGVGFQVTSSISSDSGQFNYLLI